MEMRVKKAKELIGSGKLSEYANLSKEEREKRDAEWLAQVKPNLKPKDFRDD